MQIKTCKACRRWLARRRLAQVGGVAVGMLLVLSWMLYGSHGRPPLLLGLSLFVVLAFFVVPVVLIVVDCLLSPFLTFSVRRRKVSYMFVDEQFTRDFAAMNGGEVPG